MRSALSLVVTSLCIAGVFSAAANAQATGGDTLPFRKGQWGVEFPIQESYSITLLRFRSPSSALLVDGALTFINDRLDDDEASVEQEYTLQRYELRLGRRMYRPLAFNTAGFLDLGVTPSFMSTKSGQTTVTGESLTSDRTMALGVFASVGGNYFVTPRLSVGMSSTTSMSYSWLKRRGVIQGPGYEARTKMSGRGLGFSAHTAVITAGIYF